MTPLLPDDFVGKCVRHFAHACEKHPKFCNGLLPHDVCADCSKAKDKELAANILDDVRSRLSYAKRRGTTIWSEVLDCEVWEATEAMANDKPICAIEELYDCIAVLMRTICVLEGKQELAKEVCE